MDHMNCQSVWIHTDWPYGLPIRRLYEEKKKKRRNEKEEVKKDIVKFFKNILGVKTFKWCWKNNLCFTCCSWIRLSSIFLLLIYCFFVLLSCLRLSSDSCVPLLDWWYKLGSTQLLLASSLEGLSDFVVDFY